MDLRHAFLGLAWLWIGLGSDAMGQGLPRKRGSDENQAKRLPNDQLEGALWEYRLVRELPDSKQKREELETANVPNELRGRWRMDEGAVYEPAPVQPIEKPGPKLAEMKRGQVELKLPAPPAPVRIGDVTALDNGRKKIAFVDSQPFHGSLTIWPKPGHRDVWEGFGWETNAAGNRVQKWQVEMRLIED